jgi:glycerate kinase
MRLESSFVLEPLTGVAVESAQMYKQLQAESAMVSEAETEHQFYDRILNQRD